jgi:hypothetical protein
MKSAEILVLLSIHIHIEKASKNDQFYWMILDANIIRPSRSPYASPVIFVPKKDNTIRMCVELRRLI